MTFVITRRKFPFMLLTCAFRFQSPHSKFNCKEPDQCTIFHSAAGTRGTHFPNIRTWKESVFVETTTRIPQQSSGCSWRFEPQFSCLKQEHRASHAPRMQDSRQILCLDLSLIQSGLMCFPFSLLSRYYYWRRSNCQWYLTKTLKKSIPLQELQILRKLVSGLV